MKEDSRKAGRRKPRGVQGFAVAAADGTARFEPTELPTTKEEIEQFIIDAFDHSLDFSTRARFGITGFTKIAAENDMDCLVRSTDGDFRMELTELVTADMGRGGHEAVDPDRLVGESADRMLERIRIKAAKYSTKTRPWLLIYPDRLAVQRQPIGNHCGPARAA